MPDAGREFHLRVTGDKMKVLVDCVVVEPEIDALVKMIEEDLEVLKIERPPPRERLVELLRLASKHGGRLVKAVVVEGKPMVRPRHGKIEWARDFFHEGFIENRQTGAVDFRQHAENLSVDEGELIARVTMPVDGERGCDVFGKALVAGRARTVRIRAGSNVRKEEGDDGLLLFYAMKSGRIRWSMGNLDVDHEYNIMGDVGMKTGDIAHTGALVGTGDVQEGSKVDVDGDMDVRGIVEAADVRVGGNVKVGGGITGKKGHSMRVDGSLDAKYIIEGDIEVGGDVAVKVEIVHARVTTEGSLFIPGGRIVGGEVLAGRLIQVGQAGSEGYTRTSISVHDNSALGRELMEKRERFSLLNADIEKIHAAVDPLMAGGRALKPEQKEAAKKLLAKVAEMEMEIEMLRPKIDEIREARKERGKPHILIRGTIFPGVTLNVDGASTLFRKEVRGNFHAMNVKGRLKVYPAHKVKQEQPAREKASVSESPPA